MSNVWVVTLSEQLHDSRDLGVVSEQHETESSDGGPSDIVINIGNGEMKKLLDHLVATGTSVGEGDGKHSTISENSVLHSQ